MNQDKVELKNKKKECRVIIGFVVAVLINKVLIIDLFWGGVLSILSYYLAIQGLKTKQRGLAIATIIIVSVGIGLYIFVRIFAAGMDSIPG